jgi:hypothetical protein
VSAQRGIVAAALARAESWLLEPAPPAAVDLLAESTRHQVVAVVGRARRCGATTVARALAAELAARSSGAAIVAGAVGGPALPLGTPAAGRLARAFENARACGRLCLLATTDWERAAEAARERAPLVLDVRHGEPPGAAAAVADRVVLLGSPRVEPALAAVVAASLARTGPEPVVAVNRARPEGPWAGRPVVMLPESPAAARIALAGGQAPGAFGTAIGELADLCG